MIKRHPLFLSLLAVGFLATCGALYQYDLNRQTRESVAAAVRAEEFKEHMHEVEGMSAAQLETSIKQSDRELDSLNRRYKKAWAKEK